jgi:FKBP-type peptidyl-prolyl cis-trans isomerase SlyD
MKAADMAGRTGRRAIVASGAARGQPAQGSEDSAPPLYNPGHRSKQELAMQIGDRTVASFHYTLTDEVGTVIDSSRGREPLAYLHGAGNIVPGLEKEMVGHSAGDRFDVLVSPEEGYGQHEPQLVQVVPREAFQGVDDLQVGMEFQAHTAHGPMSVAIAGINGDEVTVDGNHPLAGKKLHFAIEVTEVRDASLEELSHGHVHGPGGHHH